MAHAQARRKRTEKDGKERFASLGGGVRGRAAWFRLGPVPGRPPPFASYRTISMFSVSLTDWQKKKSVQMKSEASATAGPFLNAWPWACTKT